MLRDVQASGTNDTLQELELVFKDRTSGGENRLVISGLNLAQLPHLDVADYPKGLYMPMGVSVPPFYQSYDDLLQHPPHLSSYFNVLLDAKDRWINHHPLGVDGVCAHLDKTDPKRLHVYLLSYERMTLIGHFIVTL